MSRPAALALCGLLLALPAGAADTESTCVTCHLEEDEEIVEEWRLSVHAEADVTCDACHGGDPAEEDEDLSMDEDEAGFLGAPGWDEVPEFCGSCHEDILDGYGESVMAQQLEEGEEVAVCTTCHMTEGHHIRRADPRRILTEERCSECHDGARALEIRDLIEALNQRLAVPSAELAAIHHRIDTSEFEAELAEIRHRSVVIAHTYDRVRIEQLSETSNERLDALAPRIERLAGQAEYRRRLGSFVVGGLVLAFLVALGLSIDIRRGNEGDRTRLPPAGPGAGPGSL